MNSRTFIFSCLLFAVIVSVSSELVAPKKSKDDIKKDEAETQMVDEINGRGGGCYGGGGRGGGGGLEGEQGEVTINVMEEDTGINGGGAGYGKDGYSCRYRRCCRYEYCYCCAPNAAGDIVEDITQN